MPGEFAPGSIRIDTPVGAVDAELHADGRISVGNVASYRSAHAVAVEVPGIGEVIGDVAWGGNWFFLISRHDQSIDLRHVEALTDYCSRVRAAINAQGHPLVDHVELFAPVESARGAQPQFRSLSRARPMTAPRAAPARARNSPVLPPTASSTRAKRGSRKA